MSLKWSVKRGGVRRRPARPPVICGLEDRTAPAIMAMMAGSVLVITGDENPNEVNVSGNGGTLTVTGDGGFNQTFMMVSGVQITTFGGDDDIDASGVASRRTTIDSGAGDDTVLGGSLPDSINAGADDDSVVGGSGADTINGGEGNDTIMGGTGSDSINGGAGNDSLDGEANNDTLIGNDGDDTLDGGFANDSIVGGSGNDTVEARGSQASGDTVNAGSGDDTLVNDGTQTLALNGLNRGNGFENVEGNGQAIQGTSGDDNFDFNNLDVNGVTAINGLAGNDSIVGSPGPDTINGGDGNDTILGQAGSDSLTGGAGNDTITPDGAPQGESDTVSGGEGDDTILVAGLRSANDSLQGGGGNDTIRNISMGGIPIGLPDFGPGNSIETIDARGARILGDNEADSFDFSATTLQDVMDIFVLGGDDTVIGSDADDTINAGTGSDSLTGNGGADTFVISNVDGGDQVVITDFEPGNDTLDLPGTVDMSDDDMDDEDEDDVTSDGMGNTIITLPSGKTVLLQGVEPEELSMANFN